MPERLDIKLSYLSNNNCMFCVNSEDDREQKCLSDKSVKNLLENAKKNYTQDVVFTGGEPTLFKKLFDWIRYAKQLDFKTIMIISNGRILSNKDYAEKLIKTGVNKLMISVHGLENTHDHLTRVKGSYKQTIKGIKNLKNLNQEFITDTVANKINYKELPEIIEYLLELGSEVCQIDFVIPCGNAWKYKEKIIPKYTQVVPFIHKTIDQAKDKGDDKKILVMGIPYCFMKDYVEYINEPNIPKIKISSVESTHSTDDYNIHRVEGKIKPEKCSKCEYFNRCEGLWENYVKMYGTNEINPI
jgi:MoaA/NifB/PqqE/SkfB family radical SAM enzyme